MKFVVEIKGFKIELGNDFLENGHEWAVQVYNQKSKFKEIPKVFLNLHQPDFYQLSKENSPLLWEEFICISKMV